MASSAHCTSSTTRTTRSVASSSQRRTASKTSSRGAAGAHASSRLAADLAGDVVQGRERARGEQAVAGAPDPGRVGQRVLELLDQRRLADAGLAGDQHEAARARASLGGVLEQRPELRLPLEQRHVWIVLPLAALRPCRSHGRGVGRADGDTGAGLGGSTSVTRVGSIGPCRRRRGSRRPSRARGSAGGSGPLLTSSARAASWSATTWNGCQQASMPADAETRWWSSSSVARRHRAAGVGDDQDPLDTEQVDAEHQRLERLRSDAAAGVAEDLGVAVARGRAWPAARSGSPCRSRWRRRHGRRRRSRPPRRSRRTPRWRPGGRRSRRRHVTRFTHGREGSAPGRGAAEQHQGEHRRDHARRRPRRRTPCAPGRSRPRCSRWSKASQRLVVPPQTCSGGGRSPASA